MNNLTSPDQQNLNILLNKGFKIFLEGNVVLKGTDRVISIDHNLGFIPEYSVECKGSGLPAGWNTVPYFVNDGIYNFLVQTDISKTKITFIRNFTFFDVSFYYSIYRNKNVRQ